MLVLQKNGQQYGCPNHYADRSMDSTLFQRVIAILRNPEVKPAGTWDASLASKLQEAGMEGTHEQIKRQAHQVVGWLSDKDLVALKMLYVGTCGIVGLFIKFADGVEVIES